MDKHKVVSRQEWVAARTKHLAEEKEFTKLRDELSRKRRDLPWVKVEEDYVFDTPDGKQTLAELFDGRSQLVVYHFMYHPSWEEGCPSCSFWADNFNGFYQHLAARDVALVAVSKAPLSQLGAFKKRMGWTFRWVSSAENEFNRDYHVSFTEEEMKGSGYYNYRKSGFPREEGPGISVFYRDDNGVIFHTYSCYARGLDMLNAAYHYLDLVPKGRDEQSLGYSMAWLRHHDKY